MIKADKWQVLRKAVRIKRVVLYEDKEKKKRFIDSFTINIIKCHRQ